MQQKRLLGLRGICKEKQIVFHLLEMKDYFVQIKVNATALYRCQSY